MLFRPNPSSGVPIYLQLMEQVKHGTETGAIRPGEQLPGIRPLAEELVIALRTADTHVERILGKLGFTSRAQVAAWVATQKSPPIAAAAR